MRAIAAVLVEQLSGTFSGKGFAAPLEGREDDSIYVAALASDTPKDEPIAYRHRWASTTLASFPVSWNSRRELVTN